jgi:predicted TIM-barrel fold metal-dependent hydrolase
MPLKKTSISAPTTTIYFLRASCISCWKKTSEYLELAYRILTSSEELDGIVLLALDAVYSPRSGKLDEKKTDVWISNRFIAKAVQRLNGQLANESDPRKRAKRFFYGASISPNRRDWREELEFVALDTNAVLIKLIPSVQHIDLKDSKHKEFYKSLTSHGLPLLCHVGPEYSFPEGIREYKRDNFRLLERALDCGVTVIAAHCATPVFPPPIDRNEVREFHRFMKKYNSGSEIRLWGDTSAFCLSTRVSMVHEILETFTPKWLVHGSDFPVPIDGWVHLPFMTPDVTVKEYLQIQRTRNPLDKDVRIKRAHGFSDSILENAEKVLRMPKT